MLGPHDLEDFFTTVDRDRESRKSASADTLRHVGRAFTPMRSFSAASRLARGGMFGGFGDRS